jgi:hypothetical protein
LPGRSPRHEPAGVFGEEVVMKVQFIAVIAADPPIVLLRGRGVAERPPVPHAASSSKSRTPMQSTIVGISFASALHP